MAFGFGFKKQKVLSSAEKFVQQGKLQNAIAEYAKILKNDPKDLTVINTVGDLHARLGENDKAADCFKNVGDAYAAQGFTVKAIAMYKKLSKLKNSTECVLRLAELYTQQGLFNDARAQYLQVAEDFLKSGQPDQAVRIFEKTLEMDPENVAMRTRLAEVYVRIGKKEEAWKILTAAAESLKAKGQLAAAEEILQRMLKLEPGSSYALMMKGRAALDSGDAAAAVASLSKVANLDTNPEGLRALFQGYLKTKNFTEAAGLVNKLSSIHNDNAAIGEYADALLDAQQYREALAFYEQHADELLRNDPGKFVETLRPILNSVQGDPKCLEAVLSLFQKAGDNVHLTEIYELLAHAYVQSGELEKSREYYLKLTQLEPANQMHARNYQQVMEKMGATSEQHLITAEEGSVMVDELEATAPFIDQRYGDEITLAVRAALTDAELFISYNMPAKALAPLLSALPKAPRDLRLNQKLAALHTRAGRFTEAAVCCRTLESIYHDAGHAEEASRYGDLAAKYEERGGTAQSSEAVVESAPKQAATEFEISAPEVETFEPAQPAAQSTPASRKQSAPTGLFFHSQSAPKPVAPPAVPVVEPAAAEAVAQDDASGDWEQDFAVETSQQEAPAADSMESAQAGAEPEVVTAKPNLEESVEEVRFYLSQGMTEHAEQMLAKLEAMAPGSPELAVLRTGIDSTKQKTNAQSAEEVTMEEDFVAEEASAPAAQTPQPWPRQAPAQKERPVLQEMVSEIEQSLGDSFLDSPQPAAAQAEEPTPEPVSAQAQAFRQGTLDQFVSDLEASLGSDFAPHPEAAAKTETPVPVARAAAATAVQGTPATPTVSHPPVVKEKPAASPKPKHDAGPGVDLANMFGELKEELEGEATANDEDPETHYNLGVAFREMGLLDEAIGEFQKVCQASEQGHPFSQMMQTYTWLAQCFLEKGVPEAAIRWYERALKIPTIDQETRTALHYELASSFESAGNNSAALSNFLEVYGNNIDYRDVAERIKALRP